MVVKINLGGKIRFAHCRDGIYTYVRIGDEVEKKDKRYIVKKIRKRSLKLKKI